MRGKGKGKAKRRRSKSRQRDYIVEFHALSRIAKIKISSSRFSLIAGLRATRDVAIKSGKCLSAALAQLPTLR